MTEQFANNAATTLSAAIESVDGTSISVTAYTGFPASAQYRILVDDEIMIVTGGAGTTTWTVTRGVEGTTAATHTNGAAVTHVLTAGALLNINPSQLPSDAATDGQVLTADGTGGAAWEDASGASTFTALTDTPASYVGNGGKFVAVKTTENGLEFL